MIGDSYTIHFTDNTPPSRVYVTENTDVSLGAGAGIRLYLNSRTEEFIPWHRVKSVIIERVIE